MKNDKDNSEPLLGEWEGPLMVGEWEGSGIWEEDSKWRNNKNIWHGNGKFSGGRGKINGTWSGEGTWTKTDECHGDWNVTGKLHWNSGIPSVFSTSVPLFIALVGVIVGIAGLIKESIDFVSAIIIFMIFILILFSKLKGTWYADGTWTYDQGLHVISQTDGKWNYGFVIFGMKIFNIKTGSLDLK